MTGAPSAASFPAINSITANMTQRIFAESSVADCLDFLVYKLSGKFCSGEDDIGSILKTLKTCSATRRYTEFFSLVSVVVQTKIWEELQLQDLLVSIVELEKKYKHGTTAEAWLLEKRDILLQLYLCVLRGVVGVQHGQQLGDRDQFCVSSTASATAYSHQIVALMQKYKGHYLEEETGNIHDSYQQQQDALLRVVVERAAGSSGGDKEYVWDHGVVFDLLHAHRADVFQQNIILFIQSVEEKALPIPAVSTWVENTSFSLPPVQYTPCAPQPHQQHKRKHGNTECVTEAAASIALRSGAKTTTCSVPEGTESLTVAASASAPKALALASKRVGRTSLSGTLDEDAALSATYGALAHFVVQPSFVPTLNEEEGTVLRAAKAPARGSVREISAEEAAYRAELRRKDKLDRRQLSFLGAFMDALEDEDWPPEDQGESFDAYWQGEGVFKGVHYAKSWEIDKDGSKVGYLTTHDGMVLQCHDGVLTAKCVY